jgi:hypothetical protein
MAGHIYLMISACRFDLSLNLNIEIGYILEPIYTFGSISDNLELCAPWEKNELIIFEFIEMQLTILYRVKS